MTITVAIKSSEHMEVAPPLGAFCDSHTSLYDHSEAAA
jgi:hypothetical protein